MKPRIPLEEIKVHLRIEHMLIKATFYEAGFFYLPFNTLNLTHIL